MRRDSVRPQILQACAGRLRSFWLAKGGDHAGAAVQHRRALALAPGFRPARHALLEAALEKESWTQVAEHAAALLEQEPKDAALALTHGIALRHLGRADEALAAYDRADALAGGKLPEVRLARGVLHARVRNECEPAVAELRAYVDQAGALAATGTPALRLLRECEQILDENRRALEAAREMQRDAERKAEEAARKAREAEAPAAPAPGGAAPPTPPPSPTR